ncbi:MAG: exodeoxyribonuclease VII large subunit [Sphingomonadales bacterium]|jgi:exodeoxyribonuclease VII large subunit
MSDFENNSSFGNVHEYSVSEISNAIKRTVEDQFGYVRLRGELSGFKRHSSGHLYMALKDDKAVIDGVMWRGNAARLGFRPEDGLEVVVTGKVTTYPGRSKYQIVIDHMEPAGVGALMALLEQRKKQLASEGLFLEEHKRPLPFLPKVIGVVTSPTGAVIRDILHRLNDRCPRHVLVWPVAVQGEGAAEQVAEAIQGFNALKKDGPIPRPDVLIVARGGGSLEDLWAFNEEVVVRAAAASDIPLISAVGHETDTTLIDYASDRRAPTPTAAAEMAVPVMADLRYTVEDLAARLDRSVSRNLDRHSEKVAALGRAMPQLRDLIAIPTQRLDEMAERLPRALSVLVNEKRGRLERIAGRLQSRLLATSLIQHDRQLIELDARMVRALNYQMKSAGERLNATTRLLDSLSYERVLERGFAVVMDEKDKVISTASGVKSGAALKLRFRDGDAQAVGGGAKASKKKQKPPEQGQLF